MIAKLVHYESQYWLRSLRSPAAAEDMQKSTFSLGLYIQIVNLFKQITICLVFDCTLNIYILILILILITTIYKRVGLRWHKQIHQIHQIHRSHQYQMTLMALVSTGFRL